MERLLRATMRLRPDRIVVGEVRGAEALAFLKAWNMGHPSGVATVHANSAQAGLIRLEQLIAESGSAKDMRPLIAEAIDLRQCAVCYTDFWSAYEQVLPQNRHRAVGEESGKTNHIESFNLTLRLGKLNREITERGHSIERKILHAKGDNGVTP